MTAQALGVSIVPSYQMDWDIHGLDYLDDSWMVQEKVQEAVVLVRLRSSDEPIRPFGLYGYFCNGI